jgi:hypothetical protein
MSKQLPARYLWFVLPAAAMMLGWGLRGYIGGGPLGAMIPGAMTALALAILLGLDEADTALLAAFGAVGVGFGGQMTYGQTVGLAFEPETFWWALLGFLIKGAVWGFVGGAVMGVAIERRRVAWTPKFVWSGLALMTAAVWIGWKLINEPKLIYFSNRLDKPRPEIWAGLLLGGLALLAWMARGEARRTMWTFALWGGLGGGIGFASGAWIQVAGRAAWPDPGIDWWKMMEFTFGLLLGLGYGIAAWQTRRDPGPASESQPNEPFWKVLAAAIVLCVIGIGIEYLETTKYNYSVAGAILLAASLHSGVLARQTAITITVCAFGLDLLENKPEMATPILVAVILATAGVAWLAERWRAALPLFILLTVTATVDAFLKSYLPGQGAPSLLTQGIFVATAVVCVLMARRVRPAGIPVDRV